MKAVPPVKDGRRFHIPRECREEFIPVDLPGASLRENWGINLAGFSDLTPGYFMNRRKCPFTILICVLEGEGVCRHSGEDIRLQKGDVYLERAGGDQHYWSRGNWKILWFHLDREYWSKLPSPFSVGSRPEEICSLKSVTDTYLREGRTGSDPAILTSLGDLTARMIGRFIQQPVPWKSTPGNSGQDSTRDRKITDRLHRSINREISREWTVAELANLAEVTPSYLYKITARTAGNTPLGLVRDAKMDVARQLLLHSDYPLKFIAERIGYSTAYTFSKAFKKEYGMSPGGFRENGRDETNHR